MLPVLVASAAWAAALLGLGHLLARRLAPGLDPATTGLLGYLVLAAAGTLIHLVAPVGPWVAAAALAAGLLAFARRARALLATTTLPGAAALLLLLAGLSALNGFPLRHYDMGLYWLQAVKWTTESAQVPGLATLHARLGFNSAWFTVAAMLEHPLAVGRSAFLISTTALFLGGWLSLDGLRELRAGRRDLGSLLAAASLLVVATAAGELGGQSPDAGGAVLAWAALVAWARALSRGGPEPEGTPEARAQAVAGALLALLAATVKLSYALLPAAGALLLLAHRRWLDRRAWLGTIGAAAALLLPWLAHGILASGCPLFPSQVACLPVPWATPASIGNDVSAWVRSWARAPGVHHAQVLGRWDWLPGWADATLQSGLVQLVLALLAAGAVALALLAAVRAGRPGRAAWLTWAVAAAGTAGWFALAPTPRFGWAWLLALAAIPAAEAAALALARWPGRATAGALLALLLGATAWLLPESLAWLGQVPASAHPVAAWPTLPAAPWREQRTLPGAAVVLPVLGDQCWSAPRPCTPYFDPGLSIEGVIRTYTANPVHP